MALVKRVCAICGHESRQIAGCGRTDCDWKDALRPHDHCDHEDQHGLCTTIGCKSTVVPLGLVNPPIDGSAVPDSTPAEVIGLDLDELAEACTAYLYVHGDSFNNDLSPFGPAVERLRTALHPRLESAD